MDVSRQQQVEGEIPIPINSNSTANYATNGHHGHMIHHHHHHDPLLNNNNNIISSNNSPPVLMNGQLVEDDYNNKKVAATVVVRYRECLKNHAASMGGNATDGCGEFMPSGEEGTIEALNCSACNCHRNFHRKEVEGEHHHHHHHPDNYFHRMHQGTRKFLLAGGVGTHPHNNNNNNNSSNILPSRTVPPHHHMIMPFNYNIPSLPSESDEQELDHGGGGGVPPSRAPLTHHQAVKKRFRTKFTPEQKEKMLSFADKVGWKLQKQEDSVVQHFCQEIGVKRRVLKVWMHNNKHNLANKINNLPLPLPPTSTTT